MPIGRWNGEAWGAVLRKSANPDEPDRVSPRWCGVRESDPGAGHGSEPARDLPPRVGAIHESPALYGPRATRQGERYGFLAPGRLQTRTRRPDRPR